jgi:hypothetical protein
MSAALTQPTRRAAILAAGLILSAAVAATATDEAAPVPTASPPAPAASLPASVPASPSANLPASPYAPASTSPSFLPLPADVVPFPADLPTVSLAPESEVGMGDGAPLVIGTSIPLSLGHCGLFSPVDVDGSLWQPVGGLDATGGAIDTDEEIGELINATVGELTIVDEGSAVFRTSTGQLIAMERADGNVDYPLCM